MLFAAIADDYTGGSDLAGMLGVQGVRTAQLFGVPQASMIEPLRGHYDAVVVCLKSRSIDSADACKMSLAALQRLLTLAPRQIQFKYCSTFDSTRHGNIGPVTEALMGALGVDFTVAVPALPVNGRTQYMGYLFVNGVLLSESPMARHPLNPMTEPNLVRHLQPQTSLKATLIRHSTVRASAEAIRKEIARLRSEDGGIALLDTIAEEDLANIAEAVAEERLITGGSGITKALPAVWRKRGWWSPAARPAAKQLGCGRQVLLLVGSCSAATLEQIEVYRQCGGPLEAVDVEALMRDSGAELERLLRRAAEHLERSGRCLVYSSADAAQRDDVLRKLASAGHSAEAVRLTLEELMGQLAFQLKARRIVVAGGETSGAVLDALSVRAVEILDELDPGVPALRSLHEPAFGLVLKSGNFGARDFLIKAAGYLGEL